MADKSMPRFYSDDDIRTLYRQAKNKKLQIKILADLNCCTKDEIREILFSEDMPEEIKKINHLRPPKV